MIGWLGDVGEEPGMAPDPIPDDPSPTPSPAATGTGADVSSWFGGIDPFVNPLDVIKDIVSDPFALAKDVAGDLGISVPGYGPVGPSPRPGGYPGSYPGGGYRPGGASSSPMKPILVAAAIGAALVGGALLVRRMRRRKGRR